MKRPSILCDVLNAIPEDLRHSCSSSVIPTLSGLRAVGFPERSIPYALIAAYMCIPTIEALLRNRAEHYAPPGRMAPENRLWSFDKIAPTIRELKVGRAGHRAMAQVYHHQFGIFQKDTLTEKTQALFEDLTFNTDHALGLIGRFRIVCALMDHLLSDGKIASVGSIACGAAEATTHGVLTARAAGHRVGAYFFDNNPEALAIAEDGFQERAKDTEFFLMNAVKRAAWFTKIPLEGVELTGIIDYLPDTVLIPFLAALRNPNLKFLVTCNILRKPGLHGALERAFVHHALQWPMHYRTHSRLRELFAEAGYHDIHFINEPRGMFTVILWLRNA